MFARSLSGNYLSPKIPHTMHLRGNRLRLEVVTRSLKIFIFQWMNVFLGLFNLKAGQLHFVFFIKFKMILNTI